MVAKIIESATTPRAIGLPGRIRSPSASNRIATAPMATTSHLVFRKLSKKQHDPLKKIVPTASDAK